MVQILVIFVVLPYVSFPMVFQVYTLTQPPPYPTPTPHAHQQSVLLSILSLVIYLQNNCQWFIFYLNLFSVFGQVIYLNYYCRQSMSLWFSANHDAIMWYWIDTHQGSRCSSVFAHGAMGRRIDPSCGKPIELFLVPASAPQLV